MSTRYMKKVYGGDIGLEKECENASDTEVSLTGNVRSKDFNVFDLLNQHLENEVSENDDLQSCSEATVISEDTKRKKKKKKHKKPENATVSSNSKCSPENNVEDDIEQVVNEINKLLGEPVPGLSQQSTENATWTMQKSKESILSIQRKHLNPFNELKKIFGSRTVQAEQNTRRNRGRSGYLKKTWLVSARENWPPITKSGLSMTIDQSIESKGNVQYFIYEHNSSYRQIQMKFLQAVESMDPDNIITITNICPYHVDALLQLSELCKLGEQLAMAAELTERALYCLECAFHPSFNLTTANCRLDYRKQQNRALFITLFKHLIFVGGRACYRTSLEFCKLLLSLDPEGDPLAVVLALDFYALRAREYTWFVEFCELWDSTRNLIQLPNIAYSLALANFHLGNKQVADELLQNALFMFPGVLMPLLNKCSVQTDSKVMGHDFFNSKAITTTSAALEKMDNLYVSRSYHLWKETDVLHWLEQAVYKVLERVDSGDDFVKYCEEKRSKRYQGRLPKNILRHILLSDIKDIMIDIQENHNEGPVLSHDPLPPSNSIDIYPRSRFTRRTNQNNSNLLSLFFSSLFVDTDENAAAAAANGFNLFDDHGHDDHA